MITVRRRPGYPTQGLLRAGGSVFACALGRSGTCAFKREGDGATPVARMAVLGGFFRADRLHTGPCAVPMKAIRPDDGWCDAPCHAAYNRPVRMPFAASHERIMRDDRLYDAALVLDWNITSRRRHRGSAIFFHIAREGFLPTEGCIAVTPSVMRRLLKVVRPGTVFRVIR
ncbi:MAG: hypothetical protein KDJ73_06715 [Notoacmeibacter sp.]|nr:hypothetical protein [Notoacmeibacter sp.]